MEGRDKFNGLTENWNGWLLFLIFDFPLTSLHLNSGWFAEFAYFKMDKLFQYSGENSLLYCPQMNNENLMGDDIFLKSLLSFMNESDDYSQNSSGYASEVFSLDNVVTSGNFDSFSGKMYGELIYRRCNFSNRLYASWTGSSAGLISSCRETNSTFVNKKSLISNKSNSINQNVAAHLLPPSTEPAIKDKALFFRKCLGKSLLPALENHPVTLRLLREDFQVPRLITKKEEISPAPSHENHQKGTSSTTQTKAYRICRFCLKNGEPEVVYTGHILKGLDGSVSCPILRRYVCDLCGATGSYSHTRKYCPRYEEAVLAQSKCTRKLASGLVCLNLNHK